MNLGTTMRANLKIDKTSLSLVLISSKLFCIKEKAATHLCSKIIRIIYYGKESHGAQNR
jgi:hypothetical protein